MNISIKSNITGPYAKALLSLGLMIAQGVVADNNKEITEIPWAAFGDVRGNLEPCGCDPRTDLGGIRRVANFLLKQKSLVPDLLVLGLGNNENPQFQDAVESKILLAMLSAVEPTATLYNNIELADVHFGSGKELVQQNYVLSNVKEDVKLLRPYKAEIETKDAIIFGFVSPEKEPSKLKPLAKSLVKKWQQKVAKSGRNSILLFSGSQSELEKIIAANLFDTIIRSNSNSFTAAFDHREKEKPESLIENFHNKTVFQVPLGGLGIVLGGGAEKVKAPSLESLFKVRTCSATSNSGLTNTCDASGQPSLLGEPKDNLIWLTREYEDKLQFADKFNELAQLRSNHFDTYAEKRKADLNESPYAGSLACKGCHEKAFEIWSKSDHAHAYATLEKDGQSKNMECVACHVVGYEEKGGFASKEFSPQFANVQCENCHGPRLAHIANPSVKSNINAKDVCVSCHKGAHSPEFKFEEYWSRIRH